MNRTAALAIAAAIFCVAGFRGDRLAVFAQGEHDSNGGHGSKILFSSTQHVVPEPPPNLDFDPRMQLYVMNGDGTDQRQITDFLGVKLGVACSPNGEQIAFHGVTPLNSRPGVPSILLMDAGTVVDQSLNGLMELVSGGLFASWSPDGKKIVFQSPPPGRDIFVLDLSTNELTNLTNDPTVPQDDSWDDFRPDWSPNGHKIAFTSSRDGSNDIYVMNADGSDPVRLTVSANPAASSAADWSPNGKQIVFQTNRDASSPLPALDNDPGTEIYVMNADGTNQTRLTSNQARDVDPNWSPNGNQIVFDSDRDIAQTKQVYVMNADGSDAHALTGAPVGSHGESAHADSCWGHAVQP
jgi:Tol biopolymer transport system component